MSKLLGSAARSCAVAALFGSLFLASCSQEPPPLTPWPTDDRSNREPIPETAKNAMFRVKGDKIVTGSGAPIQLRGIAFGNEVWDGTEIPSMHHNAEDFARVKKMGMNTVRFYMNYKTFEEDDAPGTYKESGWHWIDQNIEWARENKVRLILNMHVPPGGYQSGGKGSALWEEPGNQERFVNLWHAIAERYRAEPVVVGYDILNEPVTTRNKDQWRDLAQRAVDAIRLVDQHHIIFVERVNAIGSDWSEDKNYNFIRVNDDNVVYEFHFYKPFHFTHQNAAWTDFAAREGWYPDEHVPEVAWYQLKTEAVAQSDMLPAGDSEWSMLETKPFVVRDEKLVLGKPFLVCDQGVGAAVFDSLSLTKSAAPPLENEKKEGEEKTAAEGASARAEPSEIETLFELDLDTRRGWFFWNPGGKAKAEFVPEGNGDHSALQISGAEGPANLGSDPLRFPLEQGSEYVLSGLIKGVGLAEKARCHLRLEFYSSKVPVQTRGKEFLKQELDAYLAWGEREKVPLYLGEFGTIRDSFLPGRGGVTWVKDMLDLIQERELSFAYHSYHEMPFGLFIGDQGLPSVYSANLPLYETFVKALLGPEADTQLVPTEPTREIEEDVERKKPKPTPPPPAEKKESTPENYHDFE